MSSTSRSLTVLKENLRRAETEMHQHRDSVFHHNQSRKPSGGPPVGLSIILPILQGCEVVAAASPLPFLAPAFAATVKLIKSIQAADSNRGRCADLAKKTSSYLNALRVYDSCSSYDSICKLVRKHNQEFARSLEQLKERSNEITSHGTLYDIFHSSENKAAFEKIDRELETARDVHFLQLFQAMRKEMDTLHKEHSSQQNSSPPPYPAKDSQPFMGPKLSPNEERASRHTKADFHGYLKHIAVNDSTTKPPHGPHSGGYMRMPVPDIGGGSSHNYTFEVIQMPTPEPYYPHLSQPRHYYMAS